MEDLELTVLLPTLNEAESLAQILGPITEAARAITPDFEILVVDGNSKDDTAAIAKKGGARLLMQSGPGFGSAVREGLAAARGRFILTLDADGSHPPSVFKEMWRSREGFDLVIGSRYAPGGTAAMPLERQVLSRALNFVSRGFLDLPVRDSSSGFRLYRAEALRPLASSATDFSIQQDLLVRLLAAGGRACEVPFHYAPRLGGKSKADAWALAPSYLKMLWSARRLRGGFQAPVALALVLAVGLLTGLCGIDWGLPGDARLRMLPQGRPTAAQARAMTDSWKRLYQEIGASHKEMKSEEPVTYLKGTLDLAPGWQSPPDALVNSYRSFMVQSVNPDEKKSFIILSQMRPWKLEFKPLYVQYGGAFIYPLGAFLKGLSLFNVVELVPDLAHYLQFPEDMGRLYLAGRVFLLIFHLGTLWLLFDLGSRLSNWQAGFAAALLFALCPAVVINSHILKPHPYAAFWALAGLRFMLLGRPILCGVAVGLAAGANLSLIPFLGLPALGGWRQRDLGTAAKGTFFALAVCLALNPFLLLSPKDFAWETQVYAPTTLSLKLSGLTSLLQTAGQGMGWLPLALAFAAFFAAIVRPGWRRAVALVMAVVFIVLWSRFAAFSADAGALRLYYPLVALACLLAGDLIGAPRWPTAARLAVLALLLGDSGLRSAAVLRNLHLAAGPRSNQAQAADWIEAHVPPGSELGLVRFPEPSHVPPLRFDRYRLRLFARPEAVAAGREPEYLVVDDQGRALIDNWAQNKYDALVGFSPPGVLWARLNDGSAFINGGVFVYRRKGAKGA